MRVKDLVARAGWDATGSLTGRTIRVTGFIIQRPHTTYLAKLPPLTQDQWVEVAGTVVPDTATPVNNYTPTLVAASVTPIPVPADPYDY
ncbi:hypothetical protein [Amycolatopsis methanolica]|uniref:hypothetical protein n=1 Tax=Amycolatopsis methanolica TaxID=1814 RepID=UPI00344A5368